MGAEGSDRLLADAQAVIDSAPPVTGVGTARDGRIRAVVEAPGLVTELELDPRVMRPVSVDLSAALMEAGDA